MRRRAAGGTSATMPTFRKCAFCGRSIPGGTGMMHVRNDGRILWTCSMKCNKNMFVIHRDARKLKWTEKYVRGGAQVKKK